MPWVCHSLICVQKGSEKLPSNLEFLLAEIPKWFKKSAKHCGTQDVLYKARLIKDMLTADCVHLYFVVAQLIVVEFEKLNSVFQATNANPEKLVVDLRVHYESAQQGIRQ